MVWQQYVILWGWDLCWDWGYHTALCSMLLLADSMDVLARHGPLSTHQLLLGSAQCMTRQHAIKWLE